MGNEVNDKELLEKAEDATTEVEEATVDELEEIDTDKTVDGEDVFRELTDEEVDEMVRAESEDEESEPAGNAKDSWLAPTITAIIILTITILVTAIAVSDGRTKQISTLLDKVSSLEETVAILQEAEDKDVVKSYKGVLEGVRTVTEKGKTKYYVTISCAGEFEVSQNIYEEVQHYVGCILNWYEHTTFDEEGAKVIWYNYDIESVG